jgi:hypothetical protein
MASAASSSWKNYCVMDENMHFAMFLKEFYKIVFFIVICFIFAGCMKVLDTWILDNWEFTVLG